MLHDRSRRADDTAHRCPNCGTRSEAWIDPETGRRWAQFPLELERVDCYGCDMMDAAHAELDDNERRTVRFQWVPASDVDAVNG